MKTSPLFHEQEVFEIALPKVMSWSETSTTFGRFGFQLTDDFVDKMRSDSGVEVWQTTTIATVNFLRAGEEVYPDESDFDSLSYAILPCTLPEDCVRESITLMFNLGAALGGAIQRNGQVISLQSCLGLVDQWSCDILQETGDVMGSESARILLEMKHQR
jgi:hypothetical protein